ncbi:exopolyphosphatase / guanosine-5'-triphosphate,3'-diphosphate pyrophosphatase [Salibacterium halotolerans]|uniref:exopolyphosphatase n=2 Tax=Salibacterium halotolerans TaxID=1884432 RepID=A0A1I5NI71_9BACI|nr:exopolyphosphatase / guanosine-5'-triphosphate,3'-diphosphate pyrophosphatase [Salibacterium halotolerans]
MTAKEKVAVIDIGSNSIRLVINELDEKTGTRELQNLKLVARLNNHIDNDNRLTDEGMNILKESLCQFEEVIMHHGVDRVKAVATAAVRNASNQQDILDYIHNSTSMNIRVLSEDEEAYYGYLAVVNSTDTADGISIDIGGGSSEITFFKNKSLIHTHSFPFGALTLKKKFFPGRDPQKEDIKKLSEFLRGQFESLPWLQDASRLPVIGIGGSARNMALVHQARSEYPLSGLHQYEMTPADIQDVLQDFEKAGFKQRENMEGLSKDRADVIIPAVRVIHELISYLQSDYFMMSSKGLREGLFFEELLREHSLNSLPDVAEESFFQLSREFEMNEEYVQEVGSLARKLYAELEESIPGQLKETDNVPLLQKSARVLYIGEFISHETSSQHTFYVLTNRSIDGVPHSERLAMAFIASFKSKAWMKRLSPPFQKYVSKKEFKRYELLGSILKLSYALDRTKRQVVQDVSAVQNDDKSIDLYIGCREDAYSYFEEMKSQKYKKHVEKILKQKIALHFYPISELNKTFTF